MNQFGVEESLGIVFDIVDKRLHQILRLTATGSYEYPVSGMDMAEYACLRHKLLRIDLLELFQERIIFHPISSLHYLLDFLFTILSAFLNSHHNQLNALKRIFIGAMIDGLSGGNETEIENGNGNGNKSGKWPMRFRNGKSLDLRGRGDRLNDRISLGAANGAR
jgi:hypothetical protein